MKTNQQILTKIVRGNPNIEETAAMVWELYRDKVLDNYQTVQILTAIGCNVCTNRSDGTPLGYTFTAI